LLGSVGYGGIRNKAARGELPVGFGWGEVDNEIEFHPDEVIRTGIARSSSATPKQDRRAVLDVVYPAAETCACRDPWDRCELPRRPTIDGLIAQQPRNEAAPEKKYRVDDTLVLYDVSSSYMEGAAIRSPSMVPAWDR